MGRLQVTEGEGLEVTAMHDSLPDPAPPQTPQFPSRVGKKRRVRDMFYGEDVWKCVLKTFCGERERLALQLRPRPYLEHGRC